jgi:hypothetical protein
MLNFINTFIGLTFTKKKYFLQVLAKKRVLVYNYFNKRRSVI